MDTTKRLAGVYKEEHNRLITWLRGKVGEDLAQDILQEVVARAMANLDSLEPVRDLAAWIWRAVRNSVIDSWRSRGRRARTGEVDYEDFDTVMDRTLLDAGDSLERDEILDALAAAIEELPAGQRQVIVAQCLSGETFASLSERTGLSVDTLAARKRYALARLRKSLADYCL